MTDDGEVLFADSVGARVPPHARAQIHSVFLRAWNIETDSGELLTLLEPGSGNLPHGIRCASPIAPHCARIRQGHPVILEHATLRFSAAGFAVDLSRAAIWNGTVAAALPGLRGAEPQTALDELYVTLRERAPDRGIAPALFFSGNLRATIERTMAARMARTLPMLARATETGDAEAVVSAMSALVGLGTGLTPAGDDFIVGYLAALWSRAQYESGMAALLSALAVPVGQLSLGTNAISRQMLLDALQGHFAERLTEVVRCVCVGRDVAGATMKALHVGHSSGADALCGLLFGYSPLQTARPLRASAAEFDLRVCHAARAAALAC